MKSLHFILALCLLFTLNLNLSGQSSPQPKNANTTTTTKTNTKPQPNVTVDKDGNYHAKERTSPGSGDVETGKVYTDSEGQYHKVYQSKNGKHFVWKKSKKSGELYRYYLRLPGE